MTTALLISVIGMGLVFGAILLLWLFMELIVRFFGDKPASKPQIEQTEIEEIPSEPRDKARIAAAAAATALQLRRQQAAAIAVAVALAQAEDPGRQQRLGNQHTVRDSITEPVPDRGACANPVPAAV